MTDMAGNLRLLAFFGYPGFGFISLASTLRTQNWMSAGPQFDDRCRTDCPAIDRPEALLPSAPWILEWSDESTCACAPLNSTCRLCHIYLAYQQSCRVNNVA